MFSDKINKTYFVIFQGLMRQQNTVVVTPCGSGKSLIFQMGVIILKKIKNIENGIGICCEPLNNILCEKSEAPHSAYLTLTGENIVKGNAVLSSSSEDIESGEVCFLYGHPESFLSVKGTFSRH